MQEFSGKTAVVTGAASGIGRAMAERCADEGMQVVLADVDLEGVEQTRVSVAARGASARVVPTDVSKAAAVEALADAAEEAFGEVHLVFNNAGVLVGGCAWENSAEDWEWVLGVNLFGAIHGSRVFLPRMLAHGEPAHMVNTASIGGLSTGPWLAPYLVSKHAVVALTECLHHELVANPCEVRVSALCPGGVATGIGESERVRPVELEGDVTENADADGFLEILRSTVATGMQPAELAGHAFDGIRDGRFWILPDPIYKGRVEHRTRNLLAGRDPSDPGD